MDQVNKIIKDNNFKFKKHFGQNFLTDTNLLKAIVTDANITTDDEVLEIGPGAGSLTKELATVCKRVVCYEIDTKLQPILQKTLKDYNNVEVVYADILKQDNSQIKNHFDNSFKVVANLPYYITTPIIFKFLESELNIKSLTVMVQKEVAERLVAKENTKSYGTITISASIISNVKITRIVKRQMFNPAPNVDSAIVRFDIQKDKFDIKNKQLLKKLIKAGFSMRRKTLINNLKKAFSINAEVLKEILLDSNLNLNVRAESLTPEQFVFLSNKLNNHIN
jgi:16S rRNA (adenine1518-N6/adenine1519-N6)-dimethyltransferase